LKYARWENERDGRVRRNIYCIIWITKQVVLPFSWKHPRPTFIITCSTSCAFI